MRLVSLSNRKSIITLVVLFFMLPIYTLAQAPKEIKGQVIDSTGLPLESVTVAVKGKQVNAITNSTGSFSIKVKEGDVLTFNSVGYRKKEVTVTSQNIYNITLQSSTVTLGDAVVIGYGRSSRKTLSSSIVSVKPEELNKGAISDVGQLLQGKVPGLNITASGNPGSTASVVLRGASTINSPAGPFYVIDGVPGGDISTVAPGDIASVDVLKDAAATAIYGNKAANGVIMITTKKAKKGVTQTNYNGYVGIESVTNGLKLMNSSELTSYIKTNNQAFNPSDNLGANTNWMKEIEKSSAVSHNHYVSFTGGNDKSTYSASVNYLSKEGVLLSSKLERVIARLSIDHYALNNKLKFSLGVTNSGSNYNNVPLLNVALLQAVKHLPVSPVYNTDGTFFENFNITGYYNPVSLIKNAQDNTKYNALLGYFNVEAKLPFNFTYNANFSYQQNTSSHGEYYNSYYSTNYNTGSFYNNPDPGFGSKWLLNFGTNGSAVRNSYQSHSKTIESFLTWDKKINDHSINAVIGYSWQDNVNGDGFQATNTNFVSDYTGYMNLGLGNYNAVSGYTVNFGSDLYSETRFISDFARLNYSFQNKYLLQASVRRDGSSVFGSNNRWGYFPSVGLAWRITQEKFMQRQTVFDELKLRASYGETGNALGFGAYTAQQLYGSVGTYYNNGVFATAIGATQGSNPDLKWEKTSTTNLGLDFSIYKGIVTGSIDVYDKVTTGMIYDYSVSTTLVPGGSIWANGGKIDNKGIEVSISSMPIKLKNFTWTTTLSLSSNKNEIKNLDGPSKYGVSSDSIRYSDPEGPGQTTCTLQILKVGHPVGQFFSLIYEGKDNSGNSQFLTHSGALTTSPTIGTDYFYVGNADPKILLGWANTLQYKNFDFNLFIRGVFGNKIFNATRADLSYTVNATTNNLIQSASEDKMTDSKNNYYSNRYIESGSYVRFDNATLGYKFKLNNQKYVNGLRVYLTGNNLFVITKYKGIDPEITQGGIAKGIDYNNFYPKTRTFMLGVNVSF